MFNLLSTREDPSEYGQLVSFLGSFPQLYLLEIDDLTEIWSKLSCISILALSLWKLGQQKEAILCSQRALERITSKIRADSPTITISFEEKLKQLADVHP